MSESTRRSVHVHDHEGHNHESHDSHDHGDHAGHDHGEEGHDHEHDHTEGGGGGHDHGSMNMEGVFLHVLGDAVSNSIRSTRAVTDPSVLSSETLESLLLV